MPSKSRVVRDQRKTEEIIQAYGHEATPENLALFNGVVPTRILNTPSHDTGAEVAYAKIEPLTESMDLQVSPVDGLAPADLNKSRDSKPGGLNTIPTKHEDSITKLGDVPPTARTAEDGGEDVLVDSGTYITPEVLPSVTAAGVPLQTAEEKASAQEAAQARKAEVADREKRAQEEKRRQQERAEAQKSHK